MNLLRTRLAALRGLLTARWLAQTPAARGQLRFVLSVCVLVYTVHYLAFTWAQPFFIEDSAISFAYARNLVRGEGLVPFAGGERVEGYSNALWTFLVAAFYGMGVHVWVSSKVLGWIFGVVAMFASWGLVRAARPDAPDHWSATVAPLLLACSTQFVLWNASGLENSLFCALLSVGAWRLVHEVEEGGAPWSALCFFGLTMTRPDGLAYAGIAGFARVAATVARRQWLAATLWALAFGLPYGLYNAWRYEYFAWWWPNTYYAKSKDFRPFAWTGAGWKMVKDYFGAYGIVYALPLFAWGAVGWQRWRKWLVVLLGALFALFVLWDGRADFMPANDVTRWISREWSDARIWFIVGAAALAGAASFAAPGWLARGLLWASLAAGVFFCVWANGDWMKGFRWFSLTSVPLFTLMAVGLGHLVDALPFTERRWRFVAVRGVLALALVVALAVPAVGKSRELVQGPETQTRDVRKRVNYMRWVQSRLGIEHVTLLDVDMGAHMYFTDWYILDIAGLIDVPVARRKWQKSFAEEYVFYENRPDFAHQHGSWARTTGLKNRPQWNDEYVEIPGYPSGKRSLHVGNHVRKDHLVGRGYSGREGRAVRFAGAAEASAAASGPGDITLEGWDVPSPAVAAGGELYVDTTWRSAPRDSGFRVLMFLVDDAGHLFSAEVAPGYDWYPPDRWKPHEYVFGRWSVQLPEDLPEGRYDLGFVVLDQSTGQVLPWTPADPTEAAPARFMYGEWRTAAVVDIVPRDKALAEAAADLASALERAGRGECASAREAWRNAKRHVARDSTWQLDHSDETTAAFVDCYLTRAAAEADPVARARVIAEARRLDHRSAALIAAAAPLAVTLERLGEDAAAKDDWETAFDAYLWAVKIEPQRSWTRRKAEEARDKRLGIRGKEPESARKTPTTPRRPATP